MSPQAVETTHKFDAIDKVKVVSETLAQVLMVNRRTVQRWVKDAGLPRNARNNFNLVECVQWYVNHITTRAGPGDDESLAEERRLLVRAQRQRHELEIAKRRDELIDAEAVGQVLNHMAVIFATQLEGLGARMATELSAISDPVDIQGILADECRAIRTATSAATVDLAVSIDDGRDPKPTARRKRRRVGRPRKNPTA